MTIEREYTRETKGGIPKLISVDGQHYVECGVDLSTGKILVKYEIFNPDIIKRRMVDNIEFIIDQDELSAGDRKLIREVASETLDLVIELATDNGAYNGLLTWSPLRTHFCEMTLQKLEQYGFKIKQREGRLDVNLKHQENYLKNNTELKDEQ